MVAAAQRTALDYARGVVDGQIPTCRFVLKACERFLRDLETADERGLIFDQAAAERAIRFVECLRHTKGRWRGKLLVLSGWQRFIVANLFGWRWKATGFRRYKRAYIEIPRKNGKSTLAAAIALYMFVFDGEGAPEVYTAATSLEQAKIVFGECKRMVKITPALRKRIAMFRQQLTIDNKDAILQPLHSASENLDGLNAHCAVVDEYHEHKDAETYDKVRTSTGARDQALVFVITTAGRSIESACYKERAEGIRVIEGVTVDDAFFVYIAGMDEGDDWTSEATWFKANPNLGVSRSLQNMREDFAEARNSAKKEADFKRYFLNKWQNEEARWLSIDHWKKCRSEPLTEEMLAGKACYVGLDLSSSLDLSAASFFFPELWAVYLRFFIPKDNMLEREKRDKVPFSRWVKEGWVIATPGNIIDTEFIRSEVKRLGAIFDVREIAFDKKFAVTIVTQLTGDGFTMVNVPQTTLSLNAACREFEKAVISHKLWHGANPVLQWMAQNVCVYEDKTEGIIPSKGASFERIDGISASVTAISRAIVQPEDKGSVYEERGVLTM